MFCTIATSERDANLEGVNLKYPLLGGANLSGADLSESDLSAAQVSEGQLATCKSIEGDTIPDGPKYEDWLKSKGRGRMGENSSP